MDQEQSPVTRIYFGLQLPAPKPLKACCGPGLFPSRGHNLIAREFCKDVPTRCVPRPFPCRVCSWRVSFGGRRMWYRMQCRAARWLCPRWMAAGAPRPERVSRNFPAEPTLRPVPSLGSAIPNVRTAIIRTGDWPVPFGSAVKPSGMDGPRAKPRDGENGSGAGLGG